MDLLFRCAHCQQFIELPFREAGTPQTCIACKRPMPVPQVSSAPVIIPDPDPARIPQHTVETGMSLAAPVDGFAAPPTFHYPQEVYKLILQTVLPTTRIRIMQYGIPVKWVHQLINATLGPIATEDNVMIVFNHAMMGNWPPPAIIIDDQLFYSYSGNPSPRGQHWLRDVVGAKTVSSGVDIYYTYGPRRFQFLCRTLEPPMIERLFNEIGRLNRHCPPPPATYGPIGPGLSRMLPNDGKHYFHTGHPMPEKVERSLMGYLNRCPAVRTRDVALFFFNPGATPIEAIVFTSQGLAAFSNTSPAPMVVGYQMVQAAQTQASKQQGMLFSSDVAVIALQLKTGQVLQWTLPKGDANAVHWVNLLNKIGTFPLVP
jgi:hypothetical protein